MNKGELEYYHNSGKMPDRYYYQHINNPIEAYRAFHSSNKKERIHFLLEQPEFKEEAGKAVSDILESLTPKNANIQIQLL